MDPGFKQQLFREYSGQAFRKGAYFMAQQFDIFKCEGCGDILEVLHAGHGEFSCCDKPMARMEPKTEDATQEKHVPYIEKIDGGYKVRIGQNAAHPMEEKHYIEWIELKVGDYVAKAYLQPGDKPEACFCVCETCGAGRTGGQPTAREYCNVHGLWKA
jgi:superoxide reductase